MKRIASLFLTLLLCLTLIPVREAQANSKYTYTYITEVPITIRANLDWFYQLVQDCRGGAE